MKNLLTKQEIDIIKVWLERYDITNYKINTDGSVDVQGNINLSDDRLTYLPFKFNTVIGNFYCDRNQLSNLTNFPNIIKGDLDISDNILTSLEGFPKSVSGYVHLNSNSQLTNTYVGEYDTLISNDIDLYECAIPPEFLNEFIITYDDTEEEEEEEVNFFSGYRGIRDEYDGSIVKLIFKYQRHFEIWNNDLTLNIENYKELIEEIKDGLI